MGKNARNKSSPNQVRVENCLSPTVSTYLVFLFSKVETGEERGSDGGGTGGEEVLRMRNHTVGDIMGKKGTGRWGERHIGECEGKEMVWKEEQWKEGR